MFQFIDSDRATQVARIKELLKPGGVVIMQEKFIPGKGLDQDTFDANEAQKDRFKEQYFSKEDIAKKAAAVGVAEKTAFKEEQAAVEQATVGMADLMVSPGVLESVLHDNFNHVVMFWDSGNFKGYMASDDRGAIDRLLANTPSTDSEFSNHPTPGS